MKYLMLMISTILLVACSSRDAYNAIQYNNRMECYKLPESQVQECLDSADVSYDEYEYERNKAKNKTRRY